MKENGRRNQKVFNNKKRWLFKHCAERSAQIFSKNLNQTLYSTPIISSEVRK